MAIRSRDAGDRVACRCGSDSDVHGEASGAQTPHSSVRHHGISLSSLGLDHRRGAEAHTGDLSGVAVPGQVRAPRELRADERAQRWIEWRHPGVVLGARSARLACPPRERNGCRCGEPQVDIAISVESARPPITATVVMVTGHCGNDLGVSDRNARNTWRCCQ